MASGVNIATAYIQLIPTVQGIQGNIANAFRPMEDEADRSGDRSGGGFLSGFKGAAMGGIAAVAAVVAATFADAYSEALAVKQSEAKAQAALGLEPDAAAALGKSAGSLYAKGYGESISEVTDTVATVFSSIRGIDISDAAGLEKLTGKAISFSQAFDVDIADAVQNVNTLMGSGLVKNADEAFDLLTKASQSVPEALRGNITEASDEYGQFFRTLGFSGQEAFDALVKGADKGEFGIDKTGDAIKEFTLLSTDMSKNTVAAYESIGLNATDMTNAILTGGDSSKEAFNKITDGILGIQDPAAQSQAALALFGTPLEDMNVQDIPEFLQGLKGMSGGMGDAAGAADQMDAAMGSTTSGVELFWRGLKTNLVDFITEKVLPAITQFSQWLGEKLAPVIEKVSVWVETTLMPAIERMAAWLGEKLPPFIQKLSDFFTLVLVPAIQQAWEWFETNLLPTIMRIGEFIGNTIGNMITILGGFIDFIIGVFTGDWGRAWDGIKSIFGGIWDQIKNIVSLVWDTIQSALKAGWDWIKTNVLDPMGSGLSALGGFFSGLWATVQQVWTWITDKISGAWTWIRDNVFAPLGSGISTVGQFFSDLWTKVQNVWGWIQDKIGTVWNWINQNVFAPMTLGINTIMTWMANLWTTVQDVWGKVSGFFSDVAKGITDAVDTVKKAIKDIEDAITERVRNWGGTDSGGVLGNIQLGPGGARGMVVPGRDPGRRDNMLMPVRSEEAIMVPEFTHAVGGASGVYTLNRAAEAGLLNDMFGPGFARGGVVGQLAHDAVAKPALALLNKWKDTLTAGSDYGPENFSGNAINTQAAIDFIKRVFGLTDVWGWRGSGSVAGSDHPKGKAIDAMIPNYGSPAGVALGSRLADWFVKNPGNFGTKYVIWRDRINQGGAWAPYSHPGGNNDTLAHRDHVHISLLTGMAAAAGQAVGESLGSGGSGVERWRSVVLQALARTGQSSSWADAVLKQMNSESSGNPQAINTWDSNAMRGTPSKGLMQMIDPTFQRWRDPALTNDIWLPSSNVTAAIRSVLGTYPEGLARFNRAQAYDGGGIWEPGTVGVNLLNKPEAVLTPAQSNAYVQHAQALEEGYAGGPGQVVFSGDIHLGRGGPADLFDEALWRMRAVV